MLTTTRNYSTSLFPYTTLFRSTHAPIDGVDPGGDRRVRPDSPSPAPPAEGQRQQAVPGDGGRQTVLLPRGHRDRKSTRLNSSHSSISYAVFCLKKKNVVRSVSS